MCRRDAFLCLEKTIGSLQVIVCLFDSRTSSRRIVFVKESTLRSDLSSRALLWKAT